MHTQVRIMLTALDGDLTIEERKLTLTGNDSFIPVGRASKSITKGILAAADNAWFDSPVMSRNHAEIKFDNEEMTLHITDIGSMHGTYLNDNELPKHFQTALNDGDKVVFGAEVRRGTETFPACAFKLNYKFEPYKAANTFAFPESSDIDDEAEENYDEFSEDDIEDRQHASSSDDDASIESAPLKISQTITAIDLTQDEVPGSSSSNSVDLTGETEAEKRLMTLMHGRPSDMDDKADPVSIGMYAGNIPILVDTEDEEEEMRDLFSDQDDQSEDGISDDSDCGRMLAVFDSDIDISDNEGSVGDAVFDSDAEQVDTDADLDTNVDVPESVNMPSLTRYAVATASNPTINLANVHNRVELPEGAGVAPPESDSEDDESGYDLSEVGEEGMRALYGAGPDLEIHDSDDSDASEDEDDIQTSPVLYVASVSGRETHTVSFESGTPTATAQDKLPALLSSIAKPLPDFRQPSPSDAALAKSTIPSSFASVYRFEAPNNEVSHTLGERSGKSAFFAAREVNKAKVNAGAFNRPSFLATNRTAGLFSGLKSTVPVDIGDRPLTNKLRPIIESQHVFASDDTIMFDAVETGSAEPRSKKAFELASSIATREPCEFLDKPDHFPIPERAQSPQLDMTSAFSYQASKDYIAAASAPEITPRSGIKIPDIIETALPIPRTASLKRKSDSMSRVTDDELRNWATAGTSNMSSLTPSSIQPVAPQGIVLKVVAPDSRASESRPTKRFKKLLENVGYVALGGATIFAALVATAPELM